MTRRVRALSLFLSCLAICLACACSNPRTSVASEPDRVAQQPDAAAKLGLHTDRVVVFKDGYGLFLKTATGRTDANGLAFIDEVPDAAVLGSFWAVSTDGDPLTMRAETVDVRETGKRTVRATTVIDLLRANTGRDVTLRLRGEANETLEASIVEVLDDEFDAEKVPTLAAGTLDEPEEVVPYGSLVLLDTADGQLVLPVAEIERVGGASLKTELERDTVLAETRKRLVFETGEPNASVEIAVIYFRPGVRWIPTYRFDDAKETGELALQAELLNEAEDIDGAEIDLVVGVPNFRFKDVVSPLVLEQALRNALHEAAPQVMGQSNMMTNAVYTQRAGEWDNDLGGGGRAGGTVGGGDITLAGGTTGESSSSLFVYHAGALALDKGSRATLPLWTQRVKRRDVFTADFSIQRSGNSGYGSAGYGSAGYGSAGYGSNSPLSLARNEVWHQLELDNDGTMPWTTGAIMLLAGPLPLAQELLTYTSSGSANRVPITVAVDVRAEWTEKQTKVTPDALEIDDIEWTKIESEGTVEVVNKRKDTVTMQVSVDVGGTVTRASDKGEIVLGDHQSYDFGMPAWRGNPHSKVTWEVRLKAGESKKLTVETEYFVR